MNNRGVIKKLVISFLIILIAGSVIYSYIYGNDEITGESIENKKKEVAEDISVEGAEKNDEGIEFGENNSALNESSNETYYLQLLKNNKTANVSVKKQ